MCVYAFMYFKYLLHMFLRYTSLAHTLSEHILKVSFLQLSNVLCLKKSERGITVVPAGVEKSGL